METIQVAADEHQVTVLESDIDRDGGRIILVAGAPQTFGDDEERLLRTLRAAVDQGLPLPVHAGVSEGRVFAGQVGATFRRTYTILGDTAALAARLDGSSRRGRDLGLRAGVLAGRRIVCCHGARTVPGEGKGGCRSCSGARRPVAGNRADERDGRR